MDAKTRTFVAQAVVSAASIIFFMTMIAKDPEKWLNTFLPLLTVQIGLWSPGPKLKTAKDTSNTPNLTTQLNSLIDGMRQAIPQVQNLPNLTLPTNIFQGVTTQP